MSSCAMVTLRTVLSTDTTLPFRSYRCSFDLYMNLHPKEQAASRSARTGKRQNERRESGVGIGLVLTFPTPVDLTLRSDWSPLLTVSLPSNSCLCPRLRPEAHPARIRTPFRS